jgi:hypothetical protein
VGRYTAQLKSLELSLAASHRNISASPGFHIMNSVAIVGFVGADPEQRQARNNGSKFTVLPVATHRVRSQHRQERRPRPTFQLERSLVGFRRRNAGRRFRFLLVPIELAHDIGANQPRSNLRGLRLLALAMRLLVGGADEAALKQDSAPAQSRGLFSFLRESSLAPS